ncbi:hypothetical protein [Undibacterium sp. RuRC25W]|uniref:hypothetical protein n=1 Tax=Undibacterium sp. RuRC25W TaxID=3413047 RepID=UPI003BF315AA
MNPNQVQPMDCLTFCINSMDESLLKFANYDAGKNTIKILNKIYPTINERLKVYILISHSYIMTQALTQLMGNPLNVDGATETISSPIFAKFQKNLIETVNKNFPMLMSKLTQEHRMKLEALFA